MEAQSVEKRVILFAEDDDDDRFIYGMAFDELEASNRFQLKFAADGADLLSMVEAGAELPALIFLDLNMPLMDGKTCLAELRKTIPPTKLPVIILSTSTYEADIDVVYLLKANWYLQKPRHYKSVVDMLQKCVEKIDQQWPVLSREEFFVPA